MNFLQDLLGPQAAEIRQDLDRVEAAVRLYAYTNLGLSVVVILGLFAALRRR